MPQFGYRGDIRFLGQNGILPLDRPHQVKVFGNYVFPIGLSLGAGLDLSSGAPLTPLAANPNYTNGGEIPEAPRGSGIQTIDGFKTRTPFQSLSACRRRIDSSWAAPETSRSSPMYSICSTPRPY